MLMDLASPLGIASSGRIQVAWSGFRDFDFWTFGQKSSGFATFWDGGFVQGCTSILGGLIVRIGSEQIDSSIKTRLERLGQQLKG